MSDKGARDHITLPFLIMYGFTGKGNYFFFSAQNLTHFNCISVYVNQSEIAKDLKQIHLYLLIQVYVTSCDIAVN